ncbi:orph-X3 [Microplitis demolitor]|uniref:uncharacterized LOC103571334 n=1 Tax=Microplitis demolitor TaxID=69319 RepID=UPI0004CC9AC3|nr:uncharacterized LOC103571334 [Microplitis demolitor]KAG6558378.1 orph-X3 [Microplitis demolitor]
MEEHLTANYVELSSEIFVPEDWPVRRFKKMLLLIAKKVINSDDHDKIVVLRVNDLPTMLIQYQNANGSYYIFEKISNQEIRDAYIIDVVFSDAAMINNPMEAGASTSGNLSAETIDENSNNEVSVDDYVVCTSQNDHGTTHRIMPVAEIAQMMMCLEINTAHAVDPHASGGALLYVLFKTI